MGHVVLGAPPIARCHLHDRLLRVLRQRGHRVEVLAFAPAEATFWRCQGQALAALAAPPAAATAWPVADFAPAASARVRQRLAARADAAAAWFEAERPALLVLDQRRGADAAMLQFVARAHGCRVLWLGDGLLPHTLQLDERGLDGDAAIAGRAPAGFRVVRRDADLLAACLAHALAQSAPFALPRAPVQPPPLAQRLADALATAWDEGLSAAAASLSSWRSALAPRPAAAATWQLPAAPFLTVLLQDRDDPRLQLDATAPPTQTELVRAAAAAAANPHFRCEGRLAVVAASARHPRRLAGQLVLPPEAAAQAATTALATVTVNHPAAAIALLAGTPVVHHGRALYGIPGVATAVRGDDLQAALRTAIRRDRRALRARALSWLFGYGHVWCSPTHPDHNGIAGLVQAIEERLGAGPGSALHHRRGPAWPLAQRRRDANRQD